MNISLAGVLMKHTVGAVLLFVLSFPLFGIEQPILWGTPVNGFSVALAVSNTVSPWNEPLLATVYVRNDSDAEQWVPITQIEVLTSFIATDGNRKQVKTKQHDWEDPPRSRSLPLSPGGIWSYTVNLHDFLVLTNSGEFVVTAKRLVRRNSALSENVLLRLVESTNARSSAQSRVHEAAAQNPENQSSRQSTAQRHFAPSGDKSVVSGSSSAASQSSSSVSPSLASASPRAATSSVSAKRIGIVAITGLVALLLAILCRASRRKGV